MTLRYTKLFVSLAVVSLAVGAVFAPFAYADEGMWTLLGGAFGFDPRSNRAVGISTAAITEALRKVYGANALVAELTHDG